MKCDAVKKSDMVTNVFFSSIYLFSFPLHVSPEPCMGPCLHVYQFVGREVIHIAFSIVIPRETYDKV